MVAGRWVLSGRQQAGHERIARRFEAAMQAL